MTLDGDIGMVSPFNNHSIIFENRAQIFWLFEIFINQLYTKSWWWHLDIEIDLLLGIRMFMGRPAGPVSRFTEYEAAQQPACRDIIINQSVDLTGITGAAQHLGQFRILVHLFKRHKVGRALLFGRRSEFDDIECTLRPNGASLARRQKECIVRFHQILMSADRYRPFSAETDQ